MVENMKKEWFSTFLHTAEDGETVVFHSIFKLKLHTFLTIRVATTFKSVYFKELKSGKTKKLSLRGSDKPPGVMKELMLRYEFDLNKLKMDTDLKCVELDHRFHVVTIIGDSKTVEQCISLVEKVIEDVRKKREMHSLEPAKERDCGICLCSIEVTLIPSSHRVVCLIPSKTTFWFFQISTLSNIL
jgi:hypothetical protein